MKVLRSRITSAKKQIFKLKDKTRTIQLDRIKILKITEEFCEDLFTSMKQKQTNGEMGLSRRVIMNVGSEDLPDITVKEMKAAVHEMKND